MIKILIADDELLVRVGLKTSIDWEANGFVIVGEAQNGKEAIEIFDKTPPDILITDIKMPIIDGLELIQRLQEKKKNLRSIILTHHDEFSYAHKAIKLGTSEYLLKHDFSSVELLKVLNKLSLEITEEQHEDKQEQVILEFEQPNNSLGFLLEKAYLSNVSKFDYEDSLVLKQIKVKHPYFFMAYGKADFEDEFAFNMKDNALIKNLSQSLFGKDNIQYADICTEDNLMLLFNIDFLSTNVKKEQIEYIASLRKNIKQFFNIEMIFGISSVSEHIQDIPKLLDECRKASGKYYFDHSEEIFFYSVLTKGRPMPIIIDYKLIAGFLDTFDFYKLHDYINEIFENLKKSSDFNLAKSVFTDLLSYARILFCEKNKDYEISMNNSKFDNSVFEKLDSIESTKKYIHDVYDYVIDIRENKKKNYTYSIAKSIEYIKSYYMKNISLEEVALYSEISKSYLSLLFKQETGINFSEYLTNHRIEKSKKYILETNLKVYEVAEKVGFDNPYYFSRVFKDRVGMSCKEYRNKH